MQDCHIMKDDDGPKIAEISQKHPVSFYPPRWGTFEKFGHFCQALTILIGRSESESLGCMGIWNALGI
jgi:hypothetical protein